jgi:D-amino peptidase
MMQGLDSTFDAVFLVSYHGSMATSAPLSHTYNPRAIADVLLNGTMTGEAGINALVAQHHGVPIAVITGDQYVGPEASPFCPGLDVIEVKRSVSRYAAEHLHPHIAQQRIREGVFAALKDLAASPPVIHLPATLEVQLMSPDMAEQATWLRGVERVRSTGVRLADVDPLRLFRTFMTLVFLTRSLVETR